MFLKTFFIIHIPEYCKILSLKVITESPALYYKLERGPAGREPSLKPHNLLGKVLVVVVLRAWHMVSGVQIVLVFVKENSVGDLQY